MTIEMISPDKLRVVLTVSDLDHYELDYASISSDDPATRRMVCDILTKAKSENGFRFRNNKLLVEVVPGKDSGCVLYLTKSPAVRSAELPTLPKSHRPRSNNAYILRCASLDDLLDAIGCFAGYPDIPLRDSGLYAEDDGYSLLFRPVTAGLDARRMAALLLELSEFGTVRSADAVREALLMEHGKPVAPRRAVQNLMRYFC